MTWTLLGEKPGGLLLADPLDVDVVYTLGATCIWCRSTDAGATFEEIGSTAAWAASPAAIGTQRDGGRFWVALKDGSLWLSRDGGVTWRSTTSPPDSSNVRSIAAESGDDGRLFVVTESGRLWVRRAGVE
jgi:photosystem II stability/assembly factor-like uncharacterized protein